MPHRRGPHAARLLSRVAALLTVVATMLAAAACGGGEATPAIGGPAETAGGPAAARTAPVETALVERGTVARRVTVSGVVEPIRSVGVNSQLSGALMAVNAEEGTRLEAGAVLARMDALDLRAQVEGARDLARGRARLLGSARGRS